MDASPPPSPMPPCRRLWNRLGLVVAILALLALVAHFCLTRAEFAGPGASLRAAVNVFGNVSPRAAPGRPGDVVRAARGEIPPFENGLGMRFVPAGRPGVLFSVWETRVQDYRAFAWKTWRPWLRPHFPQGDDHPAVNVSWEDAKAFCAWLTERERGAGRLGARQEYRLPTDEEWSAAVGLAAEPGRTPLERDIQARDTLFPRFQREMKEQEQKRGDGRLADAWTFADWYPWDQGKGTWPPRRGTEGNYRGQEVKDSVLSSDAIPGYDDRAERTAPVGSYEANAHGLRDLGGNVQEWCEDLLEPEAAGRVLRGGSYFQAAPGYLISTYRDSDKPGKFNFYVGFRVVLAGDLAGP